MPYAFSDFIYASLGEELGLTGLLAILLGYLVLVERGLRTAIGVRDGFGKLLAGGLAFVMAWQLFVVVGGITRIIPLTGLTMPFVAQWRVDFTRKDDLTDSWDMLLPDPNSDGFIKPSWLAQEILEQLDQAREAYVPRLDITLPSRIFVTHPRLPGLGSSRPS